MFQHSQYRFILRTKKFSHTLKLVSDLPNRTSMYRTAAHHPRVPAIWVNLLANRKGRRLKTAAIFSALYSSNWSASSKDASAMYPEYCENVSSCVIPFSHGSTLSAWHLTWKLFLLRELDRANLCEKLVGTARTTEFFMLIRECCFRSWIADAATIAWIVAIVSQQSWAPLRLSALSSITENLNLKKNVKFNRAPTMHMNLNEMNANTSSSPQWPATIFNQWNHPSLRTHKLNA